MAIDIEWDPDKERWLNHERGLSFILVLEAIMSDKVVDDFPHPSPARSNQRILIIRIGGRHVAVPYVTDGKTKFLKTMYLSRDLDARYGGSNDKTHH